MYGYTKSYCVGKRYQSAGAEISNTGFCPKSTYCYRMKTLTLALSTHRPETLQRTAELMSLSKLIVLEEPSHPDFYRMLEGQQSIEDHLLELDVEYPLFSTEQYRLVRDFHRLGKKVMQVEPFWHHLYRIQDFLADGNGPADIDRSSVEFQVYDHERVATGRLIAYYKAVRGTDYLKILRTMDLFARADAARFRLRDQLRTTEIMKLLPHSDSIYVEAGAMHLLLKKYLFQQLAAEGGGWRLKTHFIELEEMRASGYMGSMVAPGDELTLAYMFGRKISKARAEMLCAQTLVYAKLVWKEEILEDKENFPYTRNDLETIKIARMLDLNACRELFFALRPLGRSEAVEYVQGYLRKN